MPADATKIQSVLHEERLFHPPSTFAASAHIKSMEELEALRAEATADLELKFDRRGCYREDSFGLATRFPFAFFTKTRHVALAREILVYPRVEATDEALEILPLVRGEWEVSSEGAALILAGLPKRPT